MSDLFEAAAARAQQKRADEKQVCTLEDNLLIRIMNERKAAREAEEAKAAAWEAQIRAAFDEVITLANSLGRKVKEITWNGEVAFVVREGESVRLYIGKIRDLRALQIAVAHLMNGAMGC